MRLSTLLPLLLMAAPPMPAAYERSVSPTLRFDDPPLDRHPRFQAGRGFGFGRRSGGRADRGDLTTERLLAAPTEADARALCAAHERRITRRNRNRDQRDARIARLAELAAGGWWGQ